MNVIGSGHESAPAAALKVLVLEDTPTDAELIERTLRDGGLAIIAKRVETETSFSAALDEFGPDIVLTDFKLPTYDGLSAIKLTRTKYPETPVIVVTGVLEDEAAVELIKAGAADYVLKDRLARLPAAVEKAIFDAAQAVQVQKQEAAAHAAEKNLYAIATYAQDAILMMNDQMVITFWNKSAEKCFGYAGTEAIGRPFYSLLATNGDEQLIRQEIDEFVNAGREQLVGWTHKVQARKRNGASSPVDLSISLVQLEGKWNAIGVVRPHMIEF
jgi:PAS domain S-box-containing protein